MDTQQLKENLAYYGADLYKWPEDIRQKALNALDINPELKGLVEQEKNFEDFLLFSETAPADPHLAVRIISASAGVERKPPVSVSTFLVQLFGDFRLPQPAFIAIVLIIIGIAIGFSSPFEWAAPDLAQSNLYEFLYYDGDVI